jgi:hypothetical protein
MRPRIELAPTRWPGSQPIAYGCRQRHAASLRHAVRACPGDSSRQPRPWRAGRAIGSCTTGWASTMGARSVSRRTSGSVLPAPAAHPGSLTSRWAIMRQRWSCRLYPTTHQCPTPLATNRLPGTARSAENPGRAHRVPVWDIEIRRPLCPKISQTTRTLRKSFKSGSGERTSSGPGSGKHVQPPGRPAPGSWRRSLS